MAAPRLSGLRLDEGIVSFAFSPSIGIMARDIDKLGLEIRSFKKPLEKAIGAVMIPSFRRNFDAGGRPSWPPMAEATQTIRQEQGFGGAGDLLVRTGQLRMNMGYKSIWTVTDTSASIQDLPDRIWYGKIHQEGQGGIRTRVGKILKANPGMSPGTAAKRAMSSIDKDILSGKAHTHTTSNIPARPFVMFQEEDMDAVYEVFQEWLGTLAAKAGWVL